MRPQRTSQFQAHPELHWLIMHREQKFISHGFGHANGPDGFRSQMSRQCHTIFMLYVLLELLCASFDFYQENNKLSASYLPSSN